jgi:hypothetical protein
MRDTKIKSIACLQHQNKSTVTSEEGDYNNITKCNVRKATLEKKDLATKKY